MVFYRKYRPQKIEELDNKQVRDTLFSVLSLPEVPHAFLFTGPKGLGKTSTARILAKAVNCEKKLQGGKKDHTSLEPCNECDQCTSITNGTNLDILEIDAASNRGIDEIRDLRDKIKLAPIAAKKKVYIIDEVHMLTTEAFNALLKTLEEPPSHAMFILCTTELHKVPATILSRCFHVAFHPATTEDIARSFKRIAIGEGLTIEDAAISEIATLADGGFRDATKLLEELVAMGEKQITTEVVEKRFKVASSRNLVTQIIDCFQKRDAKAGLETIQTVGKQGIDMKQFLLQITEKVHNLLLGKAGIETDFKVESEKWKMEELRELLLLLNRVIGEMKYSVLPQLPLELSIIEWSVIQMQMVEASSIENTVVQSTSMMQKGQNGVTVASMRKQLGDLARVKALYGEQKVDTAPVKQAQPIRDFNLLHVSNSEITREWLENFWQVLIQEMKQYNHTIAGVLRSCMIADFDKKTLTIQTAYKFHKEKLDEGKTREALEQLCKTLTGSPVSVAIILKEGKK